MMYILFICITVPLIMMTIMLDKRSKALLVFMIIGCFVCLLASELNSIAKNIFSTMSYIELTTVVTPIIEEVLKAIPILFFAIIISDDRIKLMNYAMAVGIGFAIVENTYLLVLNYESTSIAWALVRGLGAGLMHGICTLIVGFGISYVNKKRQFFYPGVFALLSTAIIYHAIYNNLVQSKYAIIGYVLPIVTFVVLYLGIKAIMKQKAKQQNSLQS